MTISVQKYSYFSVSFGQFHGSNDGASLSPIIAIYSNNVFYATVQAQLTSPLPCVYILSTFYLHYLDIPDLYTKTLQRTLRKPLTTAVFSRICSTRRSGSCRSWSASSWATCPTWTCCNISFRCGFCPGGARRIERLIRMIQAGRVHPGKLLNVKFEGFDKIEDAFKLMDAKPKDLIKPYVII